MKMLKVILGIALLQTQVFAAAWLTDFSAAQTKAKTENKLLLLDFTGSDWCGWCIKFKQDIFSQPEFDRFASQNLILMEVDFPKKKTLPAPQTEMNQALAKKFGVTGYPTIVILDPNGNVVDASAGYREGGVKNYIAELQKFVDTKVPKRNPANIGAGQQPETVKTPVPLFDGVPTAPPPVYDDLLLKGVSGPKGRRLAMINNKTFGEGDTGMIQLSKEKISLQCVEIGEDAVTVLVNDKDRRILRLKKP
jgi:protein disulfide-isomerase